MGGSIVDNLHGWITCGQCPRVDHVWSMYKSGPHVDNYSRVEHMWTNGISLHLINQSETDLQIYMVNVWIHVENVGPKPHFYTY